MRSNWDRSVALLLASEGAELNVNPPGTPAGQGEPGGASRYGVSVAALSDLRRARGLPPATVQDVTDLTAESAAEFYRSVTAVACRFDDLPVGVDYVMLDLTTNLGPAGGSRLLQSVLGAWPHEDALTLPAVALASQVTSQTLVFALTGAWLAVKRQQPGWSRYGHGWTNRMNRVRGDALNMTGEKK